ncbi:MAG: cell division protein SepF [Eubacteriales bacterium]|jgi:SepF-like predicted cell division protein (DUF552 family)
MNFIKKLLKDDEDDLYTGSGDPGKYIDGYTDDAGRIAENRPDEIIDDIPPASDIPPRPAAGVKGSGAAMSLRVMKPKSYDDGPEIADYVASGCTVVMNIEDLNRENSRRLLDFLLGAVHVLGGDLQMASKTTFVVAPCSVGVEEAESEEDGIDFKQFGLGTPGTEKPKFGGERTTQGFDFIK